jgi:hypothetical protein
MARTALLRVIPMKGNIIMAQHEVEKIDLRPEFRRLKLSPRSQGKRPTCSVFVVTEAFEFALSKAANKSFRLSVDFANWASSREGGADIDGSYFHHALDGVMKYGLCLQSAAPYQRKYDPEWVPTKGIREKAKANLRLAKKTLRPEIVWIAPLGKHGLSQTKIREILGVLREGLPVGIGANHSMLIVAFEGDPKKLKSGTFWVLDSGTRTYHTIPYEHLSKKVSDVFYVRCKKQGKLTLK